MVLVLVAVDVLVTIGLAVAVDEATVVAVLEVLGTTVWTAASPIVNSYKPDLCQ